LTGSGDLVEKCAAPTTTAAGIEQVFVNGRLVQSDGKTTGERPGLPLRRHKIEGAAGAFPVPREKPGKKIFSGPKSIASALTTLLRSETYQPISRFDQPGIHLLQNREPNTISGK
jgi:hypothetical protein